VEYDCEAVLTEGVNPLCLPEELGPRGDQKVVAVMRIDVCRKQAFDRAGKLVFLVKISSVPGIVRFR
jgi:hypothetical protein